MDRKGDAQDLVSGLKCNNVMCHFCPKFAVNTVVAVVSLLMSREPTAPVHSSSETMQW
jgi:hypothetical protein